VFLRAGQETNSCSNLVTDSTQGVGLEKMTVVFRILTGVIPVLFAMALFGAIDPALAAAGRHGAPGPIAGAGLPLLAVGYGTFWLVRRLRGRRS
jgi:hypothetical protein